MVVKRAEGLWAVRALQGVLSVQESNKYQMARL